MSQTDAKSEEASWDPSEHAKKLKKEIDDYVASTRAAQLSQIRTCSEMQLCMVLTEAVEPFFKFASLDTWPNIRKLLEEETQREVLNLKSKIAQFEIDDNTSNELVESLKDYGRSVVVEIAKEEARKVSIRMKERFAVVFNHDNESMPKLRNGKVDIRAITKDAFSASLNLLAVMAAMRLVEKPDNIEATLSAALTNRNGTTGSLLEGSSSSSVNPLVSNTWEGVLPSDVLITPVQCKSVWTQFNSEMIQALAAEVANGRRESWILPPWVIVALAILGFNEFMALLRNPIYIGVIFVLYLLGKALFVILDIPGEFQHGFLSGILLLSAKILRIIVDLLKKVADEVQKCSGPEAPSNAPILPL